MSKYRMRAAALVAAGALAGGATAATLSANAVEGSTGSVAQATGDGDGPRGHGHFGFGADPAELAKALGVSEAKLTDALDAVRDEVGPGDGDRPADGTRPTPPTEEERAEREAAFAKALADELGISESKVTTALDKLRAAHEAERRDELADRLDQAVEDGDLTSADKASVLKAYDAGVLGPR